MNDPVSVQTSLVDESLCFGFRVHGTEQADVVVTVHVFAPEGALSGSESNGAYLASEVYARGARHVESLKRMRYVHD